MIQFFVVIVDLLVLRVLLSVLGSEVVGLHLVVSLLQLQGLHLVELLLLALLPELEVEGVHHFLPELVGLFDVFLLGLDPYFEVVA